MIIKRGRLFVNNTVKYMVASLKEYGEELTTALVELPKLAVGIGDILIPKSKDLNNHLFFLIDTRYDLNYNVDTINIINELQKKDYIDFEYPFDSIINGYQHMIVIKIPNKYLNAFEYFKAGKYSKMYSNDELIELFPKNDTRLNIFNRKIDAVDKFMKIVEKEFDIKLSNRLVKDFEADYPPFNENEIFNFKLINNE